ncbi:MAG: peptide chain release factor 2 [Deltaproteobacteria bacterium]|nr:MAG: peptide chain release factor 2 [Deltaproteobacteria bacterium]
MDGKRKRVKEIEKLEANPSFWESPHQAKDVAKEKGNLMRFIDSWDALAKELEEIEILLEIAEVEDGGEAQEAQRRLDEAEKGLRLLELERMFTDGEDHRNAIVGINAGAGGTEAQDWAEMLLRMYLRWAERRGFSSEIVDILGGEEAGIKNVTFLINGAYAYGHLKAEVGIHRLVRISPFDTGKRRHTSFASVFVYPETPDDVVIEIDEADLRIDTFRASGAGGQHVNKTDSAVRITHFPTGIVVQCQNERSQHKNKATAMKILRARLYELETRKRAQRMEEIHKSKKEIAWGNQIRSYILHPYRLVKDHRTGVERGDAENVLDGDIDVFIESYLLNREPQDIEQGRA